MMRCTNIYASSFVCSKKHKICDDDEKKFVWGRKFKIYDSSSHHQHETTTMRSCICFLLIDKFVWRNFDSKRFSFWKGEKSSDRQPATATSVGLNIKNQIKEKNTFRRSMIFTNRRERWKMFGFGWNLHFLRKPKWENGKDGKMMLCDFMRN